MKVNSRIVKDSSSKFLNNKDPSSYIQRINVKLHDSYSNSNRGK
jgi:transcription initiation factor IIF auxiliary subunit